MPFIDPWLSRGKKSPLEDERRLYKKTGNPIHVWNAYGICRAFIIADASNWPSESRMTRSATLDADSHEAHEAALVEKLAALIVAEWRRRHQPRVDDEKSPRESQPR